MHRIHAQTRTRTFGRQLWPCCYVAAMTGERSPVRMRHIALMLCGVCDELVLVVEVGVAPLEACDRSRPMWPEVRGAPARAKMTSEFTTRSMALAEEEDGLETDGSKTYACARRRQSLVGDVDRETSRRCTRRTSR